MSDTTDLTQRTALLKLISDFTKDAYNQARADMAKVLGKGDRLIARSPLDPDTKLGAVYMTDPKTECRITDREALTDWMIEHYPHATETGYEVIASHAELVDVLFQHAPHLLRKVRRVTDDDMRQLRAAAVALGQPIGPGGEADIPGIEVDTPGHGVVTCKPDPGGWQAVMDLHRAGRLELDGNWRRAEIEESAGA